MYVKPTWGVTGFVTFTPDVAIPAPATNRPVRGIHAVTSGDVTIVCADDSEATIPVIAGMQYGFYRMKMIKSSGTTATVKVLC